MEVSTGSQGPPKERMRDKKNTMGALIAQNEELREEILQLRRGLQEYGEHLPSCSAHPSKGPGSDDVPCICKWRKFKTNHKIWQ